MKKIIAIFAVCLLFMATPVQAEGGGGEGGEAAAPAPDFEYYEVPPVMLPVINELGAVQQISLAISLECPYGKKAALALYGPRLVDAYIRDLFGALGAGHVMARGEVVDVETLKKRLTAVTEKVLGEEGKENMRGLLIQAVQQHRI